MTDEIAPETEALARARYESGRPMLGSHFDDPPDPTMRGTVADRPVVELVLALVHATAGSTATRPGPGSLCATTMGTSPRTSSTARPRSGRP